MGEVADIVGGGTPSTENPEYWDGDIDWYAPAEIADQIYVHTSQRKITEQGYDNSSAKLLPPGTVLFTSRAGIGKTAILACKGCTNQGFQSLVPHKDKLDSYFIFSRTEELKRYGEFVGAGSTFVEVSGKQMAAMDMMMPSTLQEQQTIGRLFSTLDNLITLHQRESYKYSLCHHDLSDVLECLLTIYWEQRKLGELVQFSKGAGYSKGDLKESGTPIILYGRLYTKYETVIADVDTFADAKNGSVYSRGGEVIVPASGETAEDISIASVVEKQGILLGGDLNIITPPADLDSAFLAISISNGKPHEDMSKMAQGKSVVHLHNTDLEKIDMTYPSHEEQTQISDLFRRIDNLITLHQRELEKLQKIKKAMLEKMFV